MTFLLLGLILPVIILVGSLVVIARRGWFKDQ